MCRFVNQCGRAKNLGQLNVTSNISKQYALNLSAHVLSAVSLDRVIEFIITSNVTAREKHNQRPSQEELSRKTFKL